MAQAIMALKNIVPGSARTILALPVTIITDTCIILSARMARAILVRPVALLAWKNGSSHSGTACQQYLSAIMA